MKNKEKMVVFNHYYKLKHDLKRTYLYSTKKISYSYSKVPVERSWITKIHPVYAMIFSFASEPIKYTDFLEDISVFLEIDIDKAQNLICQFLDRNEPFYSEYDGVVSQFPRNLIIDAENLLDAPVIYSPLEFKFDELDLKTERALYAPHTAVIMPNNNCTTDCAYCYADRSVHPQQMNFSHMQSIVEECRNLRMIDISITGGDIFLYKNWKDLFELIDTNGFNIGLVSTKTPLKIEEVEFLKKHNLRLQFSLDSIDVNACKSLLGMNSKYLDKVKHTFEIFEQLNFQFKIATVLTNLNGEIKYLSELYDFIRGINSVNQWEIRLASKSLYSKKNFDELNISKDKMDELNNWIIGIQNDSKIKISWDISDIDRYFKSATGSKGFTGARCSANYSNIMILPDGKATICEQLYWNPNYIIGDITKQSIVEIWNSEKALELAFPKREHFRNISPCKTCEIFEECYAYPNRCVVDVLKGYGLKNRDYPDPRCEKAPRQILTLTPQ